jgi:choline dehydrogenase-like flavoprotein
MLSGVGPENELLRHGISMIKKSEGVGQNLQDHCHYGISMEQKEGTHGRSVLFSNPDVLLAARQRFERDKTGPLSSVLHTSVIGYLKDDTILGSSEFQQVDQKAQRHMRKSTVPTFEILIANTPIPNPAADVRKPYIEMSAVLLNPQSRGVISLASADAKDAAIFDCRLLTHSYDRRAMIEAGKVILNYFRSPSVASSIERPFDVPRSESDEDMWDFVQNRVTTTWHMSGTARMGPKESRDEMDVVNPDFRVRGLKGLMVVDLSVMPDIISAHTAAAAYYIGTTAGEVLVESYDLDATGSR